MGTEEVSSSALHAAELVPWQGIEFLVRPFHLLLGFIANLDNGRRGIKIAPLSGTMFLHLRISVIFIKPYPEEA